MLKGIFNKLFRRKNESVQETLKTINVGDIIVLKLKNLKEIGIVDPSGYFSRRFDEEDYKNFQLTGTLTRKFNNVGIDFLEMIVVKVDPRREKQYCIMIDEILEIKKVRI